MKSFGGSLESRVVGILLRSFIARQPRSIHCAKILEWVCKFSSQCSGSCNLFCFIIWNKVVRNNFNSREKCPN